MTRASARLGRWRLALAVAVTVHLLALYWPRVEIDGLPRDSDKVVHVLLFAVPAYLGVLALGRWWPVLVLAVHAPVSELLQARLLPGRSGTAADAAADLAGVGLAALLAFATARSRARA